jgi:hypothetical protein
MSEPTRIPDTHAEAWAMLPWLANGRISAEDREWIEPHVRSCEDCRRELDDQRALATQMRNAPVATAGSEQRAFAKLWSRIEAAEGASTDNGASSTNEYGHTVIRRGSSRTVRWLAAAVVVQAVGLATLGVTAWNRAGSLPADYRNVTSEEQRPTGAAVRLVFTPDTSVESMQRILAQHGLEIVAGPGQAGNFTAALAARGQSADEVLKALRADSHVVFAEPAAN